MNKIEKIKNFRLTLLRQVQDLTAQQYNAIPAGFNNNIIWNLGHLTAAVQNVCYVKSGLPLTIDNKYVSPFLSGTKPEKFFDDQEINMIRELSIDSMQKLQSDFEERVFLNYAPSEPIKRVYGVEVNNIDQALDYLLYHEGLHAGYVLALKHLV